MRITFSNLLNRVCSVFTLRPVNTRLLNLIWLCLGCSISLNTFAQPLPQLDGKQHLGVASCASSVCHGAIKVQEQGRILHNEYIIWSRFDAHSQAYRTLLSTESQLIAQKLGLPNAHEAGICLDCHANNVASYQQGERFQITDGVGCESCHGGAENYIASHTNPKASHEDNIANGLFATSDPTKRAELCLSCHLGTEQKMASHDIMGAGHPRLSFELDVFTLLQPVHFVIDDDYRERKPVYNTYQTWVAGQLQASLQTLTLIDKKLIQSGRLFPEISLFDCHACHHPMSKLDWTPSKGNGQKPGSIRLNDGNLKMLLAISYKTPQYSQIEQALSQLHLAVANNLNIAHAITTLTKLITPLQQKNNQAIEASLQSSHSLEKLLLMGIQGQFSDYIVAEQAVMAIEIHLHFLESISEHKAQLDALYALVSQDEKFNQLAFSKAIETLANTINIKLNPTAQAEK